MYLVNGQFEAQLPIRDRGLAFGDGLFETLAIIDTKAHNWLLHYARLTYGAQCLGINMPAQEELLAAVNLLSLKYSQQNGKLNKFILKIILTRGEGGKGYQCPELQSSNWILIANPWPQYPDEYYLHGIDVQQLEFQLSVQPALAGIKHLNRLEQVLAKQRLAQNYQEALLSNRSNCIIEGISSNVFFVLNDILSIPSLEQSGINGTIRTQVIQLCEQYKIKYRIADFNLNDIINSKEIFYSNSIIGLWPVKKLKLLDGEYKYFQPGHIYTFLAKIINKHLQHPLLVKD